MRVSGLTLAVLLLTSCGQPWPQEPWIAPRALAMSTPSWHPPRSNDESRYDEEEVQPTPDPVQGPLTLRDAVVLTLRHNPQLAGFGWAVRGAEARTVQAGLWPNPQLSIGAENLGGPSTTGDTFRRTTIRLSQVIELANKRDKRLYLARADQRLAAWDYETKRLDVITQTATRHVAVVAAQARVELAEHTVLLAEQIHAIATQRVDAGTVPVAQRDKAAVRLSLERIALDRARHELTADRQALASMWGGQQAVFNQAIGDLGEEVILPEHEQLSALAVNHPRVARWSDETLRRQRAIDLAQARGVPNVTAAAGVRYFPDADDLAAVVELSAPLPLADRNQGGVLEARYRLAQVRALQRAEESKLIEELTAVYADLASSAFALQVLREETLPAARSAFLAAQDAFTNGTTDYLDVLDAERTLVEVQRQEIDKLETYQVSAARLEGFTAGPLSGEP